MGSRDPRRIMGPEKTTSYSVFQVDKRKKFLADEGLRIDGRTSTDVRKLYMCVGVMSQAKGSSYVEVGNTKVVCGVYGPRELQKSSDFKLSGQVMCDVKFAPFSCVMRKSPQPDRQQKEISRQMKEALEAVVILEKFPKAQVDVYITVVEDGGALLSTCITAAGLALCHANIDVYDLVVGASVLWNNGILYVDPSRHEEECVARTHEQQQQNPAASEGTGKMSIGMMSSFANGQISLVVQSGELSLDEHCEGMNLAIDTCQRIYALGRKALLNHAEGIITEDSGGQQ